MKIPYSFILWFSKYSICKDYEILINVDDFQMVLLSIMKYLKKKWNIKKETKTNDFIGFCTSYGIPCVYV